MISGNIVRKGKKRSACCLAPKKRRTKVNLLQRKRRTSPGRVSFIKCSGTFADADLR